MNSKSIFTVFCGGVLALVFATGSLAADLYVIANSGVNLTAADAREVFLGEKQFSGSIKLVPVDNAAVQEAFLAKVIKMDSAKYASSWTKKSFRDGLTPPALKSSDVEVIEFVKRTPGAVGYVSTSPSNVSVIQKF
jgi:hypothetical protein